MTPDACGERFAERARELLRHLGTVDEKSEVRDTLLTTATLIAELYAAGLALPAEAHPPDDAPGSRPLFRPVALRLGIPRAYYRNADPQRPGAEEVGDLEEDLEDLLGEVTHGLGFLEDGSGSAAQHARAHWRRTLPHWGHHAVEALRALHYRLHGLPG